jgi:hypothetical protein
MTHGEAMMDDHPHTERRRYAREDHDLLIRIDTRLERLEADVSEMKSNTLRELAAMEMRVRELEQGVLRMKVERSTERRVYVGIAGVLSSAITIMVNLLFR